MPFKVPVLGERVTETVLPGARQQISAAGIGSQEAQVIQQLGQTVTGLGELALRREDIQRKEKAQVQAKFKDRRDKLLANEAVVKFDDDLRSLKGSYLSLKGVETDDLINKVNPDVEKLIKKYRDNTQSPEELRLLDAKIASSREAFLNGAQNYQVKEFEAAESTNIDARMGNAIRAAGDENSDDLDRLNARMSLDIAIIDKTQGMAPDTAKNVKAEIVSAYHEAVINGNVTNNAEGMQEYYNENKDEIVSENRPDIEKVLKTEDTLQTAQAVSDDIVLKESDRSKWSQMAREATYTGTDEEQAEKRKESVSLTKVRNAELKQLESEAREKEYLDALDRVLNAASLENALGFAKRIVNPTDRLKAINIAKARFELKKEDVKTNNTVLTQAYTDIGNGKYKSLEQLRGDTLGELNKNDQTEIENFWQEGGLLGGLSEDVMKEAFKRYSNFSAEDIPVTYQNARRSIVAHVRALPSGRTKVTTTEIDAWMSDAVRGEADAGNLTAGGTRGGPRAPQTKGDVIEMMNDANDLRVEQGLKKIPLTPGNIEIAINNANRRFGGNIVVEPTRTTREERGKALVAALRAKGIIEEEQPTPELEIKSFAGEGKPPLTAEEIKTRAKEVFDRDISDTDAKQLALDQFGEGGFKGRVEREKEFAKGLISIGVDEIRNIFDKEFGGTTSADRLGDTIPKEVQFLEFRQELKKKMEDKGLDFEQFNRDDVDEFFFEEFRKHKGQ